MVLAVASGASLIANIIVLCFEYGHDTVSYTLNMLQHDIGNIPSADVLPLLIHQSPPLSLKAYLRPI